MKVIKGSLCVAVMAVAVLGMGCKASVNADLKHGEKAAGEPDDDDDRQFASMSLEAPPTSHSDFIGVTHALAVKRSKSEKAFCRCMAVAVAKNANHPSFSWSTPKPNVGGDAFVLAISSEGTPCDHRPKGRGASIRAVEHHGDDVIVTIEEAREGIPLARGAVIERPNLGSGRQGWVVFHSRRKLPYDHPLDAGHDLGQKRYGHHYGHDTGYTCRIHIPNE